MDNEVAIKVDHVSKKYCKFLKRSMLYGINDIGRNMFGLSSHSERLRKGEFWALDDISFKVKRGEALGIIGPNGVGKTTLLKLLNGIFWPDKGKITIKGKVGALIQVGAGFHPLLTGRENIYINGAILGMNKREIDKKFDSIVEFADIGDFLDAPVKFYSSGMFVRLGFAVAVHCEPDILLVDEVLAVGDMAFRKRCIDRMDTMIDSGVTIVFVSHALVILQGVCKRAILLDRGSIRAEGSSREIVQEYGRIVSKGRIEPAIFKLPEVGEEDAPQVVSVRVVDMEGKEKSWFYTDESLRVIAALRVPKPIDKPAFAINIFQGDGFFCGGANSVIAQKAWPFLQKGEARLELTLEQIQVVPGYCVVEVVAVDNKLRADFSRAYSRSFEVRSRAAYVDSRGVFVPMVTWDRLENSPANKEI